MNFKDRFIAFVVDTFGQGYFKDQERTWANTYDTVNEFVNANKDVLDKIKIGASYAPEHMKSLHNSQEFRDLEAKDSVSYLTTTFNELNIKHLKLGLRWYRVQNDEGNEITLNKYQDILDFVLNNDFKIVLNVGPIKTFRWPEIFIPGYIVSTSNSLPKDNSAISAESDVSKKSIEYIDTLFNHLLTNFSKEQLARIHTIHPENECFNPFGPREWTLSFSHLEKVVEKINQYFPDKKILINVSGAGNGQDLFNPDIIKFWKFLDYLKFRSNLNQRFIVGFDYYHLTPSSPLSKNGSDRLESYTALKFVNGKDILEWNKKQSLKNDVEIVIAEGQFESWGECEQPGNSFKQFQFMILRTAIQTFNLDKSNYSDDENIIYLWGIEALLLKMQSGQLTEDHKKIIELINKINKK